jgi:hypothetical protein
MNIQPEGEALRRAVKWISEERASGLEHKPDALLQAACLKFDLTPLEADYLGRLLKEKPNPVKPGMTKYPSPKE